MDCSKSVDDASIPKRKQLQKGGTTLTHILGRADLARHILPDIERETPTNCTKPPEATVDLSVWSANPARPSRPNRPALRGRATVDEPLD